MCSTWCFFCLSIQAHYFTPCTVEIKVYAHSSVLFFNIILKGFDLFFLKYKFNYQKKKSKRAQFSRFFFLANTTLKCRYIYTFRIIVKCLIPFYTIIHISKIQKSGIRILEFGIPQMEF